MTEHPAIGFQELLEPLFQPDDRIAICSKHKDGGAFRTDVVALADAQEVVNRHVTAQRNVWFTVNVPGPDASSEGRGTEDTFARMNGVWADLDVKLGALDSFDACERVITELSGILGADPVAVIDSGHGKQPIWALDPTETAELDVSVAMGLIRAFGALVRLVVDREKPGAIPGAQDGAKADSVFDIGHVLRCPDSINWKDPEHPIPARATARGGSPIGVEELTDRLREFRIEVAEHMKAVRSEPISPTEEWQWNPGVRCTYVAKMIAGWATDTPTERHPWHFGQKIRIESARRNGCFASEADYRAAHNALDTRLQQLIDNGPKRAPDPGEVRRNTIDAMDKVTKKTDAEVRQELGNHEHTQDVRDDETADDAKPTKKAQALVLVDMALQTYEVGVDPGGKAFAYRKDTPHVAMLLRAGKLGLRQSLASDYYDTHQGVARQASLTDCLNTLEGKAHRTTPVPLGLRVAEDDYAVNIDMADEGNRVIVISDGAWKIDTTSRQVFFRSELTQPMADPTEPGDGNLDKLWNHINVAEEDHPILLAWMIDALIQPNTSKPVLGALAEQGSAKTTTCKRIVSLIDPASPALRSVARGEDQWMTAATGSWVVALDNLSGMPQWLSDAICRASTGDGDVKRALYTDEGLSVSQFRRSVIITGIDLGGLAGDFTDRLVTIELRRIEEDNRAEEIELEHRWERDRAAILGGLLDLAAKVHAELPALETKSLPRMADFARVLTAVDRILGTTGMARYSKRTEHLMADSATSDVFIAEMIDKKFRNHNADGDTAAAIHSWLMPTDKWGEERPPQGWPRSAREVTSRLRKHAPALRSMGWQISDDNGENKFNVLRWTITPPAEQW